MKNWLQNSFSKIKEALNKTKSVLKEDTISQPEYDIEITDDLYDTLFERFIKADIGMEFSQNSIDELKKEITDKKINKKELQNKIITSIKQIIKVPNSFTKPDINKLNIFFIVGVNGSGKTTSIAKLAKKYKDEGFKVLIVAGDTFRAAAQDQLSIWAERAGVEIFAPPEIKKPDAVVFSAIEKAKRESFNLLLIDTAGRLHSQTNLMDELKKIDLVIVKAIHELPQHYEKLIVLDATIGQNAILQAEMFSKAVSLNGIILAKIDSSAKGGVVLNIINKLSLGIKFIGTGEKIDDIVDFNLDEYLEGLISNN